jgi:hypothetical protein
MASKRECTYKVTNWKGYNQSLVSRGDITFWFSDEVLEEWEHPNEESKVGRPFIYSDTAIECLLTIRELFKLPYRQTEGFGRSLVALMGVDVAIPNYSSLAKRASKLDTTLDIAHKKGNIDIVVDSTGMKVFGEGEWKMRTHGKSKRRTWRKLHLSVNPDTREIVAEVLTENSSHDADAVPEMLEQVEQPVGKFYGDGAYDKWKVYEGLEARDIEPVIPPQHNAKIKQHGNCAAEPLPRDEAIRGIRRSGRSGWKKEVGYHRRSLAETTMYRVKQTFGSHLKNRVFENQQTEARLRCKIINRFTHLGLPQFEWS